MRGTFCDGQDVYAANLLHKLSLKLKSFQSSGACVKGRKILSNWGYYLALAAQTGIAGAWTRPSLGEGPSHKAHLQPGPLGIAGRLWDAAGRCRQGGQGRAAASQLLSLSVKRADEGGGDALQSGFPPWNGTSRSSFSLDAEKFKLNRAIAEAQALTKPQSEPLSY